MSIQNGLLHHGYNRLTQEVNGMSLFVEALPHIQAQAITHVTATETEKLNWLERAVIESYKNLKAQFEGEAKREVVKKITNLGFDSFVEDAEIKFIKNMQGQYFPAFADNLMATLTVDEANRGKIREYLDFVPFTEVGQWNMMRSMYNANAQSDANYICLMTYRDEQDRMSVYTVNMKNSFQVAPDILILRNSKSSWGGLFSSSSQQIVRVPHAMTPEDLQQLLDYFDLIAFNRFMKLFGKTTAEVADVSDEYDIFAELEEYRVADPVPKVDQILESLTAGLDIVNKAWDTEKSIFSSVSKNQVVDKIIRMGFD